MDAPENQNITKKRDIALNRMKSRYPDRQFEDDEAIFGQINDDYDEYDRQIEGYKKDNQSIMDMFNADPRTTAFFAEWKKGGDPFIMLINKFGPELKDALDDPAKQEAIAKANKEYLDRVTESKKFEEEYQNNLQQSKDMMDKLEQEGMSKEDIDAGFNLVMTILHDGVMGKISPDTIKMACKALSHDKDVEEAAADAEVKGRNAKIDEKLRKSGKGDGTNPLGGKNATGASEPQKNFGALGRYGDGASNIWERGGEKRTKY